LNDKGINRTEKASKHLCTELAEALPQGSNQDQLFRKEGSEALFIDLVNDFRLSL